MADGGRRRPMAGITSFLTGSALVAAVAGSAVFLLATPWPDARNPDPQALHASRSTLAAVAAGLSGAAPGDLPARVAALAAGYPDPIAVTGPGTGTGAGTPGALPRGAMPPRVDGPGTTGTFDTANGPVHVIVEPIPGAPIGVGLVSIVPAVPSPRSADDLVFALLCAMVPVAFVLLVVRGSARKLAKDLWVIERGIRDLATAEPGRPARVADAAAGIPALRSHVRIVDASDELGLTAWAFGRLRERLAGDMKRYADAHAAMMRIDRDRLDFLAVMSHELRTPLNTILGFSEVLLEGLDGPVAASQREDLRIIRSSGDHLLALINDILDLSAIRSGPIALSPEPVEITSLVRRVLDEAEGQLRGKRVHLVTEFSDEPIGVRADSRRLWRVLQNLVGNALKFTEEGEVRVSARVVGPDVEIAVRDTGPGIAPEDLATVFDEYQQVGDSRVRRAGTGLGLAIVRRLVELHGGSVRAESELGRGSVFHVRLPLGGPPPGTPEVDGE